MWFIPLVDKRAEPSSLSVSALTTDSCLEYVPDHFQNTIVSSSIHNLTTLGISRKYIHNVFSYSATLTKSQAGVKNYSRQSVADVTKNYVQSQMFGKTEQFQVLVRQRHHPYLHLMCLLPAEI